MGRRQARLEKRDGRKLNWRRGVAFTPHAQQRWVERGHGSLAEAFRRSRFVGRWRRWYGYQYESWVFLVMVPPGGPHRCVTVWPARWWVQRLAAERMDCQ